MKKLLTYLRLCMAVMLCVGATQSAFADEAILSWHLGTNGADASSANSITGAKGSAAEGWTIAITGNTSKNWSNGNGSISYGGKSYKTLKNSNGAQNTVTLPEGCTASSVTFYVVSNADAAGKLSEINGTSCSDEVTSLKDYNNPTVITKALDNVSSFTFTFNTKQVCFLAVVTYSKPSSDTPSGGGSDTPTLDPDSKELVYDASYSGSTVTVAESLTKQGNFNGHNSFKFSYNASATFSAPGKIITGIKITSYNYPTDKEAKYTVTSTKEGSSATVITPEDNSVTSSSASSPEEVLFIINGAEVNEPFQLKLDGWFDCFSYFTIYYKDGAATEQTILSMSIDGLSLNATQIAALNADKAITLNTTTNANDVVVSLSDGSTATITGKGTNQIKINNNWTINLDKHVYSQATGDKQSTLAPAQPYYSTPSTDGVFSVNIGGDSRFKINPGTYTITAPTNVVIKQVTFNSIQENYDGDNNSTIAVSATSGTVNAPFFNVLDRTNRNLKFTVDNAEPGASVSFTIGGSRQKAFASLVIDYAETAIANAPVVQSTSKTDSQHKNHSTVTITFDHAVAEAIANVEGSACRIQGLGTPTLKIGAWNLPWNGTSTLVLPAGTVKDAYGNTVAEDITIDIEVGTEQPVIISKYDYIVSNITEFKAALDATKNNGTDRKTIFLKNGTYNANDLATGTSASAIQACQLKVGKNINLIGESVEGVSIIYTPSAEGMGERTIELTDGDYAQDITFRTGIAVGQGRGVALYTSGNHIIINNCRALGGQDTYLTGGSCYWKGGVIEGTTDFIFGNGDYLFDGTTISTLSGPITAGNHPASQEWGYVFKGCTIKAGKSGMKDGDYLLGRTWQGEPRVAFIDTDMKITPSANAWGPMGDASNTWLYEYNSTKNGAAVDLSNRFCSDSNNQTHKGTDYVLTAAQAAEYKMEYIFGEVDGWYPAEEMPLNLVEQTVSVNATAGWATFASAVDFTVNEANEVYYATAKNDAAVTVVALEAGAKVKAGEGVLVKGAGEHTFAATTDAEAISGNILEGVLVAKQLAAGEGYILALEGGKAVFSLCSAGTLAAGKSYLPAGILAAPVLKIVFDDDEATAISSMQNADCAVQNRYNLAGQKVGASYNGIVVKNGKKTVVK